MVVCADLNGSEAQRTSAHRFVADGAGATVQHLAFAVNDAVEMAEHLHRSGFSILPQTENYYADLAARFDLSEVFIAKLKSMHILYDEDESGGFLHFTAPSLAMDCSLSLSSGAMDITVLARLMRRSVWQHNDG